MLGMAPPPAQDVQSQMSPMGMASARPSGPAPGMPGQQPPAAGQPGNGGSGDPVEAEIMTAVIHLKNAMEQKPELAPYFNSAIKTIQVGLGTVLGNQPAGQGPAAVSSATPPNEPGAGMPI